MSDPKKYGMAPPADEVTLLGKDGKQIGSIKLGKGAVTPQSGESEPPGAPPRT